MELQVNAHAKKESLGGRGKKKKFIEQEPIYTVTLKATHLMIGAMEGEAILTIKTPNEEILSMLPMKSERKIQLIDDQTTLDEGE
jgi:hypothetical protein